MCVGMPKAPEVPVVPERQAVQLPKGDVRGRSVSDERRRRGMMSTILTSASGTSSPIAVTNASSKTQLGL